MLSKLREVYSVLFPGRKRVIRLDARGRSRGCVVISYLSWPFVEGWESPRARGHTNAYEVVAMAESWRALGFRVEVVDFDDEIYRPPQDCRVAIDIHGNLERWADGLDSGVIKVLHATGPHWLMWNAAELSRLCGVRDRRGVALKPRRQVKPSRGVEVADQVVVLGNEFTRSTFLFGGKPVLRVPISSAYEMEWPTERNHETARRRFLWVGSYGMVHKGLDLVLEAFAGMPDLELTVCGRPEKEDDFFRHYERELLRTPNIHFHGWLDMGSQDFKELARTHAAVVYPSSAEGGAGAVIHCMHAGLIPVCTTEASIDLGDFGLWVREATVDSVREACRRVAEMGGEEVGQRAWAAREHVRRVHTRAKFRENYSRFAEGIAGVLG